MVSRCSNGKQVQQWQAGPAMVQPIPVHIPCTPLHWDDPTCHTALQCHTAMPHCTATLRHPTALPLWLGTPFEEQDLSGHLVELLVLPACLCHRDQNPLERNPLASSLVSPPPDHAETTSTHHLQHQCWCTTQNHTQQHHTVPDGTAQHNTAAHSKPHSTSHYSTTCPQHHTAQCLFINLSRLPIV